MSRLMAKALRRSARIDQAAALGGGAVFIGVIVCRHFRHPSVKRAEIRQISAPYGASAISDFVIRRSMAAAPMARWPASPRTPGDSIFRKRRDVIDLGGGPSSADGAALGWPVTSCIRTRHQTGMRPAKTCADLRAEHLFHHGFRTLTAERHRV